MSSFLAGASVSTADLYQLSANIDNKLADKADTIVAGTGLSFSGNTLNAAATDISGKLDVPAALGSPGVRLMKYSQGGIPAVAQVTDLRDVISAGSNVSISGTTISASGLVAPSDEGTAADRLLVYNQGGPSTSQLISDLELPGKLSINTTGANTACFSIGGGATSSNVPVAINTTSQYILRGETENTYATTLQYNQHGCAYQCSMGSSSNEHPYVTFDALAANTSGQTRVANSWMRFRFNYQQRFEIWAGTTGVKAHAYGSLSDDRMKWNEEPITDGLAIVNQLQATVYDKGADITEEEPEETTRESGYIAQQVAEVLPHVAGPGPTPDDPWSVRYSALLPYHTAAIKELVETIAALEARVAALEN